MKLTHKAKENFIKWHKENYSYISFEKFESEEEFNKHHKCRKVLINTLIMEWLDSVGIYVTTNYNFIQLKFTNSVKNKDTILYRGGLYTSRQEATEKAIEKANLIYNEMV